MGDPTPASPANFGECARGPAGDAGYDAGYSDAMMDAVAVSLLPLRDCVCARWRYPASCAIERGKKIYRRVHA